MEGNARGRTDRGAIVRPGKPRASLSMATVVWLHSGLLAVQYDIRDFGAVPDGMTVSTKAITAAVRKAHDEGDGVSVNEVIIPAGGALAHLAPRVEGLDY